MITPRIKEIIERTTNEFDEAELIEVVEFYILRRKNKKVTIKLNDVFPPVYLRELNMLNQAFDTARDWLLKNPHD
jgi:hypothetical protein